MANSTICYSNSTPLFVVRKSRVIHAIRVIRVIKSTKLPFATTKSKRYTVGCFVQCCLVLVLLLLSLVVFSAFGNKPKDKKTVLPDTLKFKCTLQLIKTQEMLVIVDGTVNNMYDSASVKISAIL